MDKLEDFKDASDTPTVIKVAVDAAVEKLKLYCSRADAPVYAIATILDPRLKLDYYLRERWEPEWFDWAKNGFETAFRAYPASAIPNLVPQEHQESNLDDDMMSQIFKPPNVIERDELKDYLSSSVAPAQTDILAWWKTMQQNIRVLQ